MASVDVKGKGFTQYRSVTDGGRNCHVKNQDRALRSFARERTIKNIPTADRMYLAILASPVKNETRQKRTKSIRVVFVRVNQWG